MSGLDLGENWESYGDHALEEASAWENAFEAFEGIKDLLTNWQQAIQGVCGHDPDGQIAAMIADGATRSVESMWLVFFEEFDRCMGLYE